MSKDRSLKSTLIGENNQLGKSLDELAFFLSFLSLFCSLFLLMLTGDQTLWEQIFVGRTFP